MSLPTCGTNDTREPGVSVQTLVGILEDPKEDRRHDPEYFVEDPRKLNSFRDAGWTVIDISDSSELPLDNWGPVEVKHHLPIKKMTRLEFITKFTAIFGDSTYRDPIKVIFVSEDPDDVLKVFFAMAGLLGLMDIKVLMTDKRRI